jgi:hypothetical protein
LAPATSSPDPWRTGLAALLLTVSAAWAGLLWWAPCTLSGRGRAAVVQVVSLASYAAGRAICHQQPERSFTACERRLPVCARCSGLYLGAPVGIAIGMLLGRAGPGRRGGPVPARTARRVLGCAVAPTLASVVLEWVRPGQPGNGVRFVLALALGGAVGWFTTAALLGQVDERVE